MFPIPGLTFEIDTRSVNSNNPERDARIQAHFFDAMADGAVIRGRVKANSVGKSTLTITMNGTTQSVVVDVKQSGDGPLARRRRVAGRRMALAGFGLVEFKSG